MFLSKSLTWIQVQSIQSTFHQQWFTRWFRYRSDCSDRKGFEDRTNGGFGALCRVGTGERSFQNRTLATPTTWWNHHSEQVCFYVGLIRLDEITMRSSRKLRFIKLKIDENLNVQSFAITRKDWTFGGFLTLLKFTPQSAFLPNPAGLARFRPQRRVKTRVDSGPPRDAAGRSPIDPFPGGRTGHSISVMPWRFAPVFSEGCFVVNP